MRFDQPAAGYAPPNERHGRHAGRPATTGRAGHLVGMALLGALTGVAGCQPAIRWRLGTFEDAHQQARRARQLTFVYFRSWYRVECTDFEDHVLSDPDVRRATLDMVCVPLDFEWDRSLAQRWGIDAVPACVVVAPDGTVLAQNQAPITLAELIRAIDDARATFSASTQPARLSLLKRR